MKRKDFKTVSDQDKIEFLRYNLKDIERIKIEEHFREVNRLKNL